MLRPEYVAIFISITVFIGIVTAIFVQDALKNKDRVEERKGSLFENWDKDIYHTFIKRDPIKVAKSLGIDAGEYVYSCELLHKEARLERIITLKGLGIITFILGIFLAFLLKNPMLAFFGMMVGAALIFIPGRKDISKAEARKDQLFSELPRFLDLLQTALYINLPVEEAIYITAKNLEGTVLSEEFMDAMSDVRLGARDWQAALERISKKYDIDEFSDFVLDLTISYNKGLNIYETVVNRNRNLKQANLLLMKEKAAKLNNTILIPIVLFELIPLIALMMIPIIVQLNNSEWF